VVRSDGSSETHACLNEVVVARGSRVRMIQVEVEVSGSHLATYVADGVVVATPTGSTAYSLSAGGPIMMPTVNALLVTPVAAHSLTHRPLVVPDTSNIDLVVNTGEDEAYLSVDGQVGMPMYDGDRVRCRKSEHQVKLLRVQGTFFDVLRAKLKWGQR